MGLEGGCRAGTVACCALRTLAAASVTAVAARHRLQLAVDVVRAQVTGVIIVRHATGHHGLMGVVRGAGMRTCHSAADWPESDQ